jgi:glyoxylase-like metal-dependent hydrolase (beta-lactamase superfamily II)
VVDPQRDVDRLLALAEANDLRIRYVVETHVHNDYVSGAMEVRRATGAEVVGPAGSGYAFPFHAVADGDDLHLGALRVAAIATPGHTPEHTSTWCTNRARTSRRGVHRRKPDGGGRRGGPTCWGRTARTS